MLTMKHKDDITVTRHYYSRHHRTFETSLDVYTPSSPVSSIVVLVVGSAWMGHTPWIYSCTAWWNSAGPRTVARSGSSICICIRHRGAFFRVPPMARETLAVLLCFLVLSSLFGNTMLVSIVLGLICLWMWLRMVGQDSATFLDMQSDVEQAIQWIQRNKKSLYTKELPMYFGGYSSGAHVALSVLQRSGWISLFQGIVLISGVLAVRPEAFHSQTKPRVLTDLLLRIVFGPDDAKTIPSPIAGSIPPLPHLIIGCEREVWAGINLLDIFFCSRDYVRKARQQGIPVHYREIQSDHWFILSNRELQRVLEKELSRLSNNQCSVVEQ